MPATQDARHGIEVGDHVYVHHADRGAMAVKVLGCGRDGFTGRCDRKQRHQLGYGSYVGHKARSTPAYAVVDQGADGALVEDGHGKRRYLAGHAAPPAPVDAGSPDDPLTDRMGIMAKANGLHLEAGTDKDGHAIHRWRGTPIFPQPQRMVDAAHADYTPGGRYLALPDRRDITGQTVQRARIAVGADGKPSLEVSPDQAEPSSAAHGKVVRANLFKQRAGWSWAHRDEGTPDVPTIVSVEHGGKHHYALAAEFPHGVTLARYADKPNEPRLRPTTHGHVELGPVVGRISVRGREHPVHHAITIHHKAGGTLAKAMHATDLVPVQVEEAMHMTPLLVLFLKGGPVANRPGLALKRVTDRAGHQTQRWAKTGVDMPAAKPATNAAERPAGSIGRLHGDTNAPLPERSPEEQARYGQKKAADKAAGLPGWDEAPTFKEPVGAGGGRDPNAPPMKHGDTVAFQHGDVQGTGKIVASGADGVTVHDGEREHQVRHDALKGPVAAPATPGQVTDGTPPAADGQQEGPPNPPPLFDHEQLASLPDKAPQPFKDEGALYKASGEALDHLKEWLDQGKGVCSKMGYTTMQGGMDDVDWSKPGGMLFIAPLKGKKRAGEKVAADYGGDWSQLKDVVRCSIAVDTMDDIKDALAQLHKSGMVLAQKPKDRFNKPLPVGYRDCMMSVKFPNGCIGEVQVHLKTMLKAKEAGHKPYEVMRDIDAKPREQWSPEDSAAYQKAEDDSKAIYRAAWMQSSGAGAAGKGQGQAFGKALASEAAAEWEFFDHEGAKVRRPAGKPGGVTDILHDKAWKPYKGDRTAAYLYGDSIPDPMGGAAGGGPGKGGGNDVLGKGMALFFKAKIQGGASNDLFAAPVQVAGHTTAQGTYVAPYTANRLKAPERPDAVKAPAVDDAHAAKVAKLTRLADAPTRYEVTAHHADGTAHLLGYTRNKSGAGLRHVVTQYAPHLASAFGLADDARMTMAGTEAIDLTGGHRVRFSGRTQRSAISEGEIAHITSAKTAAPAVAMPAAEPVVLLPAGPPTVPAKPPLPPHMIALMAKLDAKDAIAQSALNAQNLEKDKVINAGIEKWLAKEDSPARAASKPEADWRGEENWHARTQAKMKTHTDDALRFIAKDAGEASRAIDGIGGSKAGQYADEAHYANMELAARTTEANDAKLLEGLPAGATFSEGKGPLGSGQWAVKVDGKMVWNTEATKEEAARVAKAKLAERGQDAVATVVSDAKDKKIGMKLTAGGDVTDDDLRHLGLRTNKMSHFTYLSDAVQRAFGTNNRKVREAMGDALQKRMNEGGTVILMANPRKALANAARFYAGLAEATAAKPAIPDVIKKKIKGFVVGIQELRKTLEGARVADDKFGGAGRYENEVLTNRRDDIKHYTAGIADLRAKASKLGLGDALEAEIESAGGVPSIEISGRGRRYANIEAGLPPEADREGPSPDTQHFYVSAIDGSKRHLVAGPYGSHDEAKGMVEHVRKHAGTDPRAHFMAWGTAGSAEPIETPLGANWKAALA